ncbi:DNA phosphorothioation-dependent restriction protein DptG [Enterovibrio norvegicus]|uniref:DNA phosphorothioation-dependent restriction protein DptG n=1 Tax=Enterovibrio norvegicus TaxID=188144 RepID=UPI000C82C0C2|nr:DNA phosphorothioation-dependent restriction protein DptG [Enterovibrio norvegicus]PMI30891.1 DNA phosphorothioation-dependent restriction protein DptG [Enterovibrio norvegicus]
MKDNHSWPINQKLPQTREAVPAKNTLSSYLPIRTKTNDFNMDVVVGSVLRSLLRKKIENYDYATFEEDCRAMFADKAVKDEFWQVLKEMYFDERDIFTVSPEFLLFHAQKSVIQTDARFAKLFTNLLQNEQIKPLDPSLTFIESEMLSTLRSKMKGEAADTVREQPYLPFISSAFREDLRFLASRPKYLLAEFEKFLSFYAFTYTAQLSLSIGGWRACAEPKAKPLYFIMDHERAGQERPHIKNDGYGAFSDASKKLFPMLSMLELLQTEEDGKKNSSPKRPLWQIARDIEASALQDAVKTKLENFATAFRSQRELRTEFFETDTALDWLGNIMQLAIDQFEVGERLNINKKYVAEVEKYLANHFVQSRGRAGRVMVLNQDYVILLTNIIIGERDKLRFHELLSAFKQRGIFVDKQTEQELVKFYERIGNVERMSDSGDAVYVRKTIR